MRKLYQVGRFVIMLYKRRTNVVVGLVNAIANSILRTPQLARLMMPTHKYIRVRYQTCHLMISL